MSKFLTYEQRLVIQKGLMEQASFGRIAASIHKDRTTVAKEIKKYSRVLKTGSSGFPFNACFHRSSCVKCNVCPLGCNSPSELPCSMCGRCNDFCADFQEELCPDRSRPPYVCNACLCLDQCSLKKSFYHADVAHLRSRTLLSESRSGILSHAADLDRINALISPLIKNGQSVHQVYENHRDEIMCCEKTLYNYIDACLFDVRNIDLPRKVKYRRRHKKKYLKVDRACRRGRTYQDFQTFMAAHPHAGVVQMDTLIGSRGGKVLLTIHFVNSHLMLAFLRDDNSAHSVTQIWDAIYLALGREAFVNLFPVILTDNGTEFSNPYALEFGPLGCSARRTHVFYCDPCSPFQKGAIEVNHELVRRILPKGSSFDHLSQGDVSLMMDHINSYKRKTLNNLSPYDAFRSCYGEAVLERLGCRPVADDDIRLSPGLLGT